MGNPRKYEKCLKKAKIRANMKNVLKIFSLSPGNRQKSFGKRQNRYTYDHKHAIEQNWYGKHSRYK